MPFTVLGGVIMSSPFMRRKDFVTCMIFSSKSKSAGVAQAFRQTVDRTNRAFQTHSRKLACISFFLYPSVTSLSIMLKWSFFSRCYNDIKSNYKDLLDADDLLRAFNDDKAIKYVRNSIIVASSITYIIRIIYLFFLCMLVW